MAVAGAVIVVADGPRSRTAAAGPATRAIGTLMRGSELSADVTLYATNRVYTVEMRPDGNLVLLQNSKTVLWSTNITGWPNSSAAIDANGRFTTRNQDGHETYLIDSRRPGTVLQLRPDGHLLMIHGRTTVRTLH
ncbi:MULTISPECIES: hypothetical protein [unclassified Kribbella]|uniref:hypothetical protein n=1 Tax=unclassified Kribbella TaxID=2644121 RepID=UPI0033E52C53